VKTYKLNIDKDVDADGDGYMLWLPFGFRFSDDLVHVRCFDTIAEIKMAAKNDVVECDCKECKENGQELKAKEKAFFKDMLKD
jgi:hypothetical protein